MITDANLPAILPELTLGQPTLSITLNGLVNTSPLVPIDLLLSAKAYTPYLDAVLPPLPLPEPTIEYADGMVQTHEQEILVPDANGFTVTPLKRYVIRHMPHYPDQYYDFEESQRTHNTYAGILGYGRVTDNLGNTNYYVKLYPPTNLTLMTVLLYCIIGTMGSSMSNSSPYLTLLIWTTLSKLSTHIIMLLFATYLLTWLEYHSIWRGCPCLSVC